MTRKEEILGLLGDLNSDSSDIAWERFVEAYGSVILQVVHLFESDRESAHDCFMFVCEKLVESRFRRLRKYSQQEGATFVTWLRSVVRNLCIDRQRARQGRHRVFRSVTRLSPRQQEVYRLHFLGGYTADQVWRMLEGASPHPTEEEILRDIEQIYSLLTPRQLWLLRCQSPHLQSLSHLDSNSDAVTLELPGVEDTPEDILLKQEELEQLSRSLLKLSDSEQLLIHLRFRKGFSLQACAESLGMENPQKIHRMLSSILSRLRTLMST